MKKRIIGILVALAMLTGLMVTPVSASIDIRSIIYNFGAAENEPALIVNWTNRLPFEIKANEFYLMSDPPEKETTIDDVEARIQEKFNDLLVDDTRLSTIDLEDPVRQDPPILSPCEEIVIIRNQEYLRTHKAFFKIHIYSLDNLGTPESELKFLTRFQNPYAGPIPDNWWSEGEE